MNNQLIKYKIQHFDKDGRSAVKEDSVVSEEMLHIVCNCNSIESRKKICYKRLRRRAPSFIH